VITFTERQQKPNELVTQIRYRREIWGNDHEVEFHEIEITIMRSKLRLFMRSNLSNNIDQEVDTLIMRSKPKQALFLISIS
jgi:hypothetical protein